MPAIGEEFAPAQPILAPGLRLSTVSTTATTYTSTGSDAVILTNNSASTAVTLPAAAAVGAGFLVIVLNVGNAGTTTIIPAGEPAPDDTINGSDSAFTGGGATQYGGAILISDGVSNWIANAFLPAG